MRCLVLKAFDAGGTWRDSRLFEKGQRQMMSSERERIALHCVALQEMLRPRIAERTAELS